MHQKRRSYFLKDEIVLMVEEIEARQHKHESVTAAVNEVKKAERENCGSLILKRKCLAINSSHHTLMSNS